MLATVERDPAPQHSAELAQMFEEHHGRIFRAAYRITGNAMDAEDVLQNVFLRLLRREHDTRSVGNTESYLYRAAINTALDLLRSKWRQSSVAMDDIAPADAVDPAAQALTRESVEIRMWLRQALTTLSPRIAEMFVLRYIEGYDNREIAQMLNTSQAVVSVTLFRARSLLQKEFRKLAGETR